jgi:hypothetical protein
MSNFKIFLRDGKLWGWTVEIVPLYRIRVGCKVARLIPIKEPEIIASSTNADSGGDNPQVIFNEDSPVIPEGSEKYIPQTQVDPAYTVSKLRKKLRLANKEIERLKADKPAIDDTLKGINLVALKRICYHFAGIVAPGWQPNAGSAFDSEWNEWLETGKIVDWHQHRDDSTEVIKLQDLTRKP